MNKIYTKVLYLLLLCLLLSLLSGCYAITTLKKDQPNSDHIISNQKNLPPACIVSITANIKGAGQNVSSTFPQRVIGGLLERFSNGPIFNCRACQNVASTIPQIVIGKLQESKIFSNVELIDNGGKRPPQPFYELTMTINETPPSNNFINVVKGSLGAASFFILTPALPLTTDFESDMTLKVIAPNMKEKEYRVSQNGSLKCTSFDCASGWIKLTDEVTDNNLICLINQMVQDEWISANSK